MPLKEASTHILTSFMDDDDDVPELMQPILDSLGIHNVTFFRCPDKFQKMLSDSPCICVIDHRLPTGETGFDMLERVKAANPYSFIIIMSGQIRMDVVIDYMNADADRYVDKNNKNYESQLKKYLTEGFSAIKKRIEYKKWTEQHALEALNFLEKYNGTTSP